MTERSGTGTRASALAWRAAQHFAVRTILLARILILAPILPPGEFGLLVIAVVAQEIVMTLTDPGMVPALVQRREPEERHYQSAWTIGVLRALLVSPAVVLAAPLIADGFGEPRATAVIQVLALRPLLQATASIKLAELARRLQFRQIAILKIIEAVTATTISIALATRFGIWALVTGTLCGAALLAILSYRVAPHRPRPTLERSAVLELVRFGRWIFLGGVILVAGRSTFQLIVSRRLGVESLGLYYLAARLAFFPRAAAAEIIGAVALPVYARLESKSAFAGRTFGAHLLGLYLLVMPVVGLLVALAPVLADEFLGPRWVGTAPVIRILAVGSLFALLSDIARPVLQGLGRPEKAALTTAVGMLFLVSLTGGLADRFGLPGAAAAWLPAALATHLLSARYLRRSLPAAFEGLLRPLLAIVGVSAVGALAAIALATLMPGRLGVGVAVLGWALLVGPAVLRVDRSFEIGLGSALARAIGRAASLRPGSPA